MNSIKLPKLRLFVHLFGIYLAFISAVNKTLKPKYLMHNFHFIDNSNIRKEHPWKDGLHLNLKIC